MPSNLPERLLTILIIAMLFPIGCQAQRNSKSYYEDLSVHRPKVALIKQAEKTDSSKILNKQTVAPTKNVNAKVDFVLDSIDRFNQTRRFVDGYTILVYSGQKRDDAMETKKKMLEEIPELQSNLQYLQPKFRVTVGKYFTRIEAQKDFVRIRNSFPNATLIPEKIMIR